MHKHNSRLVNFIGFMLLLIVLFSIGYSLYYYNKTIKLRAKVQEHQVQLTYTKDELSERLKDAEQKLQQKDEELAKLRKEVKELSTVQMIQKDIARIFDGRKD